MKIYVVGGDTTYSEWIGESVYSMEEADLVLFTGGEDVDPSLYGALKHPYTQSNPTRDKYEQTHFLTTKNLGKHMLGICRGSQFLCVMSGGILVQHQDNPEYLHEMIVGEDKYVITSTHHQAAYPFKKAQNTYKIIGYTKGISKFHEDGNRREMNPPVECEIVYYSREKSLGIQGHPEQYDCPEETREYLRKLIDKFMKDEL